MAGEKLGQFSLSLSVRVCVRKGGKELKEGGGTRILIIHVYACPGATFPRHLDSGASHKQCAIKFQFGGTQNSSLACTSLRKLRQTDGQTDGGDKVRMTHACNAWNILESRGRSVVIDNFDSRNSSADVLLGYKRMVNPFNQLLGFYMIHDEKTTMAAGQIINIFSKRDANIGTKSSYRHT